MRYLKLCVLVLLLVCTGRHLGAQGYQALHGSPYAGSTSIFNNPASSVNSAYRWDFTPFSLQAKLSTGSLYTDSSGLRFDNSYRTNFIHANFDLSFFNFTYKINRQNAIGFNLRARSYEHMKTSAVKILDTITGLRSFLTSNRTTPFIDGFVTHTGWIEADLNYSHVLMENSDAKFSAGVTLQIMKGLSGAYIKLNKVSYIERKNGPDTFYTFSGGSGAFAYSDNYDKGAGTGGFSDFFKRSKLSLGLSIGAEYIIYDSWKNDGAPNDNTNYSWKIGASIMDIGANYFKPSVNSAKFSDPVTTITDSSVDTRFRNASNVQELKDSVLTQLFNNVTDITDNFSIGLPTRLVINIDKHISGHFYVNGDLSLNFYSSAGAYKIHTRELNLLTITPRWETIGLGAYLPVQYNTQGQFWIGAAVKLGPLVLGVHNLGLFKKYPPMSGGGYLMLSFHPFGKKRMKDNLDCPW